ncbi:PH domain-containing protein [Streptomyces sp. NPDC002104]
MPDIALPRHYRTKPGNRALIVALVGGLALLLVQSWELPVPAWLRVLFIALMTVFVAWVLYARTRRFTTVDLEGISLRNALGVRRLAWDDIHDIRSVVIPHTQGGAGPGLVVYAYRTDGRRVGLPCIDDNELTDAEQVEQEAEALRSLLAEHRRADWTPDPQAEPRIAGRTAQWENAYRWVTGWRVAVVVVALTVAVGLGVIAVGVMTSGSS